MRARSVALSLGNGTEWSCSLLAATGKSHFLCNVSFNPPMPQIHPGAAFLSRQRQMQHHVDAEQGSRGGAVANARMPREAKHWAARRTGPNEAGRPLPRGHLQAGRASPGTALKPGRRPFAAAVEGLRFPAGPGGPCHWPFPLDGAGREAACVVRGPGAGGAVSRSRFQLDFDRRRRRRRRGDPPGGQQERRERCGGEPGPGPRLPAMFGHGPSPAAAASSGPAAAFKEAAGRRARLGLRVAWDDGPLRRARLPACLDHKPHRPQRAESASAPARPIRSGAGAGEVGRGAAWGLSGPEPPRQPVHGRGGVSGLGAPRLPPREEKDGPSCRAACAQTPRAEVVRRGRQLPGEAKEGGGRELPMGSESGGSPGGPPAAAFRTAA